LDGCQQRLSISATQTGNMLELLAMLSDHPQPELGIVGWSRWNEIRESGQGAMQ